MKRPRGKLALHPEMIRILTDRQLAFAAGGQGPNGVDSGIIQCIDGPGDKSPPR